MQVPIWYFSVYTEADQSMSSSTSLMEVLSYAGLIMIVFYLDDANRFPGEMEAGIEQEGEDEGERSVPAERRHKEASM